MRDIFPMESGYAILHPAVPESEAIAFASCPTGSCKERMLSILKDTIIGHRGHRIGPGLRERIGNG
jgi:hypothetical protein